MTNTVSLNQLPAESAAPAGGVLHCYDPTQPVGLRDVGLQVSAFQGAFSAQSPNVVYAGPASGGSTLPSFRALVTADMPASVALLAGATFTGGVTIPSGAINNASVGATTPNSGAFTTLSASGAVSGAGFSTYLASPPAIGATAPAAGKFTTLTTTAQSKVIANNASAQSIPNNTSTVVTTWTSVLNQGSNFVPSTGIYTAPAAGTYRVSAGLQLASATWAAGNVISIQVKQNGATIYQSTHIIEAAVTQPLYTYPISVVLNCAASDTISVAVLQTQGGAVALAGSATNCFLMISQEP